MVNQRKKKKKGVRIMINHFDWDYDPERYPRMGQLLKKKRESNQDAGIFELIQLLTQFDFLGVDSALIDRMFWSRVALRSPSPIVVNTHDEDEGTRLTYEERVELARMIWSYYKVKWEKQKAVVSIEYDPIHNYLDEWEDTSSGSESKSGSRTESSSQSGNIGVTASGSRTDNLMETQSFGSTETRTDNLSEDKTFGKTETTTQDTTDTHRYDLEEDEKYNNFKERDDYHSSTQRTDNLSEATNFGKTSTRTDNLTETKNYGKTSTRTDNLTQADSGDNGTKETQVYAFNSVSFQPSDKEIHTNWDGNTRHNTGTQGTVDGGTDTKVDTGTQGTVDGGTNTTTNTGTQTDAKTGYDEKSKSGAIERSKDGTETIEKDGTVGVVEGGTESVANTGTQATAKTGSDTVANTGTVSTQDSKTTTSTSSRSGQSSDTETGTNSRERSGVHTGNIGNLTSQKMITEEIALWKWNFIEEVLRDATEFLTLDVYC